MVPAMPKEHNNEYSENMDNLYPQIMNQINNEEPGSALFSNKVLQAMPFEQYAKKPDAPGSQLE